MGASSDIMFGPLALGLWGVPLHCSSCYIRHVILKSNIAWRYMYVRGVKMINRISIMQIYGYFGTLAPILLQENLQLKQNCDP